MGRLALFIDRDGTLVHPRHYPSHPEELLLYEGVGAAIAPLQRAGMLLVVITNQSGLARGLFDEAALDRMHAHLAVELAREGVCVDALYYCPHHPEGVIPALAIACDCRKPAPGMLLRAAAELNVDLDRSWFVGDILDDVEAGNRAGCRTVLVDIGTERPPSLPIRTPTYVARDTCHALALIAADEGLGPAADMMYRPQRWQQVTR
ncbi:MAG: HAD-IIIA family hydrolase [Chloroflexales bacterium]|nr:HAD-IIIA family hydrolase [Chloroflexales bacterium]